MKTHKNNSLLTKIYVLKIKSLPNKLTCGFIKIYFKYSIKFEVGFFSIIVLFSKFTYFLINPPLEKKKNKKSIV